MLITHVSTLLRWDVKWFNFCQPTLLDPGGGELPYEEYTGVCHELGSIFSRKNSEKGMSIFHKNSGKGYNICKKFQIGSVILMTQMTNQKKTELIDFFDLVWTKIHNFWKIF